MKKLRRSRSDRMLAGVCGGVGEYFDIDVTLVRLGVVGLTIFARVGMPVLYLVMALVMPPAEEGNTAMLDVAPTEPEEEEAKA